MKVLAVVAVVAALGMSGAALALTLDQRNDDDPMLTFYRFGIDPELAEAPRVSPGQTKTIDSTCPRGYLILSSGETTTGPAIVTGSGPLNRRAWSRQVYNATDVLSTGSELVAIGSTTVCMKARGIELQHTGP
jgi:hypothetical protein